MPLNPEIPLRAISGRRNNLVEEYAQAVNIKNALAQQKAAEAELARQENVRNALTGALDPQTGEMNWTKATTALATVDPQAALSLRGEMAKERAAGLDAESKQLQLAKTRLDTLDGLLSSVTDEASYQAGKRQAERIFGPEFVQGLPPTFDAQAQTMVQQARDQVLGLKDKLSLGIQERGFAADEAQRRRTYEVQAAEHYDKTGERLPPYEQVSGGQGGMPAGAPASEPGRMKGVIYDFNTLNGDANDPNTPAGYYNFLKEAAPILSRQLGVPEDQLLAMPAIESGMNPAAVSPTGVEGPWMLTENTAAGQGMTDRDDPMQNTYGGATYYADMFKEFGDPALAAAAYNSGPEGVRQAVQWSKDTGAPWEQSGYVRPEGVQHSRKFVEQLRVIRSMADAQKAEVDASDAPPAMKREAKKAIDSEARQAEMDLATQQTESKGVQLVTLKMPDGKFKSFNRNDPDAINKAIAEGAVEATPSAAVKQAPGKTKAAYEYALNGLDAMENDASALLNHKGLWWATGFGGTTASEVSGTDAADFAAALEPLKAHTAFGGLQDMRNASPTGGALGQVAVKELELLQNNVASLSQKQSPEQMAESLKKIRDHAREAKRRLMGAYSDDFGDEPGTFGDTETPVTRDTDTLTPEEEKELQELRARLKR